MRWTARLSLLLLAGCAADPPPSSPEVEARLAAWWKQFDPLYEPGIAEQWRGAVSADEERAAREGRAACFKALALRLKPEDLAALETGLPASWAPELRPQLDYLGKAFTYTQFELIGPPAYRKASPRDVVRQMVGGEPDFAAAGVRILSDAIFVESWLRMAPRLECRERAELDPAYRILAGYPQGPKTDIERAAAERRRLEKELVTVDLEWARKFRAFSRELREAEERSRDGHAAAFVAARNQTYPHTQAMMTLANSGADALEEIRRMVDEADTWDERLPLMRAERRLAPLARLQEIAIAHVGYARRVTYDPVMAAWIRSFFGVTPPPMLVTAGDVYKGDKLSPKLAERVAKVTRDEAHKLAAELEDLDPYTIDGLLIRVEKP